MRGAPAASLGAPTDPTDPASCSLPRLGACSEACRGQSRGAGEQGGREQGTGDKETQMTKMRGAALVKNGTQRRINDTDRQKQIDRDRSTDRQIDKTEGPKY